MRLKKRYDDLEYFEEITETRDKVSMIYRISHFSFSHLIVNNIYNHRPFVIQVCSSSFISTTENVWKDTNKTN